MKIVFEVEDKCLPDRYQGESGVLRVCEHLWRRLVDTVAISVREARDRREATPESCEDRLAADAAVVETDDEAVLGRLLMKTVAITLGDGAIAPTLEDRCG